MFKANANVADKRRFLLASSFLIIYGSALFIFREFLYPQLVNFVKVLTSASSASIWFYGLGWITILLIGTLWLCCILMFAVAKKELLALIRK